MTQCPLWVISGHMQCKKPCAFYPQSRPRKRTCRKWSCPLHSQKQTCAQHGGDVRFVPKVEVTPLFDHLVGQHEEVVWHFDPERPRGGEIDDEMEFGRLLDWEIAGLGPAQNLVHILSGAPE